MTGAVDLGSRSLFEHVAKDATSTSCDKQMAIEGTRRMSLVQTEDNQPAKLRKRGEQEGSPVGEGGS